MTKRAVIACKVIENNGTEFIKTSESGELLGKLVVETRTGKILNVVLKEIWAKAPNYIWPSAELYLLHALVESKETLVLDNLSYLVLQPDTLVSPSSIRGSEGCIRKYYVQKRTGITNKSYPMIRGTLVNNAFDLLLEDSGKSKKEIMEKVLKDFLIELASLSEGDLPEPAKIKGDLEQHFNALAVWKTHKKFLESREKSTEPTFMSRKYGMSGRLDLLVNPGSNAVTYELKTGKAPESTPWHNDIFQVACYQLLLESAFDCTNPDSYLIYSQGKGNQLLRQCSVDYRTRRKIINLRNQIVAIDYALSKNLNKVPEAVKKFIPPTESGNCEKCLVKNQCFEICHNFEEKDCNHCNVSHLCLSKDKTRDNEAIRYYRKNFRFVQLERQESRNNFARVFENMEAVLQEGKAILDLKFVSLNEKTLELSTDQAIESEIRAGDLVLLYNEKITRGEVFKATVHEIERHNVFLTLKKLVSPNVFKDKSWNIYTDTMETTFDTMNGALYELLKERNAYKRDLILGRKKPKFTDHRAVSIKEGTLNEYQSAAIKKAISAEDYFLIQGPPGTGKSHTLARLIIEFVSRGKKVLLSAFTHRAIDNVLEKLVEEGFTDFLRIGSHEIVSEGLHPFLMQEKFKNYAFEDVKTIQKELEHFPVVACSSISSMSSNLIRRMRFDVAVVDEAGQLTEPGTVAIVLQAEKFILVGDHKQLPPVVQSQHAKKAAFDKSLFERLIDLNSDDVDGVMVTLEEQYRMNEKIMEFSSKNFYNSNLRASKKNAHQKLSFPVKLGTSIYNEVFYPDKSMVFVNLEQQSELTKSNAEEARVMVEICQDLLNHGITAEQIGIITPFRAQVATIKREFLKMSKKHFHNLSVDTVDRFQGSDRDIIIFSSVISRSEQINDFYTDFRRINVTVTRAKKKFILVGNKKVLNELPLFNDLISLSHEVVLPHP